MGINVIDHPDGTYTIHTDDADPYLQERRVAYTARAHQAVEEVRRRGDPRPVLLVLIDSYPAAGRFHEAIRSQLRDAISIPPMMPDTTCHVLSRQDARRALTNFYGKGVQRAFRRADWSRSYYEVLSFGFSMTVQEAFTRADEQQPGRILG